MWAGNADPHLSAIIAQASFKSTGYIRKPRKRTVALNGSMMMPVTHPRTQIPN
jgi:hypothetical protein